MDTTSTYDNIKSFLDDYIESKINTRPKTTARIAKRRIAYGEDPLVAAKDFEAYALGQGWPSKRIGRKTRRILDAPVEIIPSEKYGYAPTLIQKSYLDFLGRAASDAEVQQTIATAGAKGINPGDRAAFESVLNASILSSPEGMSKVKTPEDIAWERQYGPMQRTTTGELRRGLIPFRADVVADVTRKLTDATRRSSKDFDLPVM